MLVSALGEFLCSGKALALLWPGRANGAASVLGLPGSPGGRNRSYQAQRLETGHNPEMEDKVISPEKVEEAKLKARYPHLGQKPGGSDFLRKRLQKGQKYFDSGDYNMAKAKMKNKQLPTAAPDKTEVTGDHIPTPQDLPQRKPSLVASKLAG
ncbi:PREDICTED: cAMP-regulated phosphoprotein 19 isoform X1 [Calidris pugnax]|uniref:cAMP-regulated phosphoprotein 19 isoform X1 n=1 Tax=Calidris pugnax TaxID=198806 RepID=UPI00071DF4B5|nr:PREDICTED: cAMP-regulated phosphoprotein 19 isoform X1 [Calidris pugnax]